MERFKTSLKSMVALRVTANSHRVRKMAVKSIALLLLCLIVEKATMMYECETLSAPINCMDNPRITISKTKKDYQLRLCSNDQCITDKDDINEIKCKDVCKICQSLLPKSG